MSLNTGDVIRVLDRQTRPSKQKRLICIVPEKQWFLRINSEPKFRPHHPLLAAETDFLSHDSYVELRQFIRPFAYDLQSADKLGRLTRHQAKGLIEAVHKSKALSQDHKDLIAERLATI